MNERPRLVGVLTRNMRPFVVIACFAHFGTANAEPHWNCAGSDIRVVTSDAALADRVCMIVARATQRLEQCHLAQWHPLEIVVREGSVASDFLAHYSMKNDQISLPAPEHLTEQFEQDSAFRSLPPAHLFESIVVHELTHAFFAETRCGQETCLAGHEYLAFAMQLEALPRGSREHLLNAHPASGPIELDWFDDTRLAQSPVAFAVNAWRHFSQAGRGCDFVAGLVSGEIVFSSEFE